MNEFDPELESTETPIEELNVPGFTDDETADEDEIVPPVEGEDDNG